MNPIDQLKSVLCGPEGKCCIAGSDEDRSIVDRALQALEEPAPVQGSLDIDRIAADRYKVVPSHESMFHRWAVVAGDGTQQLYIGREVECQNMARKFAGAFLDGAWLARQPRKAVKLTPDEVREIYLANGFTVKDGQTDLKPYVFESANAIQDAFIAKNWG